MLAELGRLPVTRRVRLSGLDRDEVAQLAELTAGAAPAEQLVAELYAGTEGNPLFVSGGRPAAGVEGRLGSEAPGGTPIPQTIREAIGRRLRTLSGECRRVLSLGSVLGREFGLVALERTADYTGIDRLLGVLDEAIAARVVEDLPGSFGRLRFGHALTRDTLYEEIPATHRSAAPPARRGGARDALRRKLRASSGRARAPLLAGAARRQHPRGRSSTRCAPAAGQRTCLRTRRPFASTVSPSTSSRGRA